MEGLIGVSGDICEPGCGDGWIGERLVGEVTDKEDKWRDNAVDDLSTMPDSVRPDWVADCCWDWE